MKIVRNRGFINIFVILLLLIVFAAVITLAYLFGSGKLQWNNEKPISTPTPLVSSPTPIPSPTLKPGWKIYKNERYGFEISYPNTYQALDDKENLYGWPDAVVLLYNGGQAYDIAIEVWDSQAEYQKKYVLEDGLTVKKVKDKYITIWDGTREEGNSEVIATFKIN